MGGVYSRQAANFVRAHWLWRHVTYPGGHIPLEDRESKDTRDTDSIRAGNAGRTSDENAPNGSGAYAESNDRGAYDSSANDAVTRANAA